MSNDNAAMVNSYRSPEGSPGTASGAQPLGGSTLLDSISWLPWTVIALVVIAAYFMTPAIPPLLDEQFLLKWTSEAGRRAAPLQEYLGWSGFNFADLWGVFTGLFNKISYGLAFGIVPVLRIQGILLHAGSAMLLYASANRLCRFINCNRWIALAAAVLFAAYPINAEAVSWFGGRGLELAGVFFIGSFFFYLKARAIGESPERLLQLDWRWMIASLCMYTVALMSSAVAWSGCFLFALSELWFAINDKQTEGRSKSAAGLTSMVIGPLLFILVTACYVAALGFIWQLTSYEVKPELSLNAALRTLRALIFPINEAIWHKYAVQYRILYFALPPFLLLFLFSLKENKNLRSLCGFAALWFLIAVFPELGHISKDNLFGGRLFYIASMPFSLLLAGILTSGLFALKQRRIAGAAVAAVGVAGMTIFFLAHINNQNAAYRNGGRMLAAVQKSLAVVASRTGASFLMASDIPTWVAVSPRSYPNGLVVFDGKSQLLAAGNVSPGPLKDALRQGRLHDEMLQWNTDLRSFIPVDLSGGEDTFPILDAAGIATRFQPGLEFVKTARFDAAANELIVESNNESGPVVRLSSAGMGPLFGDFLYVDARIDAPPPKVEPLVELYWQTGTHQDFNKQTRRASTKAIVGDGQFHRYYLPLRTIGWISSGQVFSITLGFPAGSRVTLKQLGVTSRETISPQFDIEQSSASATTGDHFDPPYFNFPSSTDLGLLALPRDAVSVPFRFDTSRVPEAAGVKIEISQPNKVFPNPGGNEASGVGMQSVIFPGTAGSPSIPLNVFPRTGVYSMRAIAIDRGHNQLGNFSDAVYVLVRKPKRTGWAEQL